MERFKPEIDKFIIESDNDALSGNAFVAQVEGALERKLGVIFGFAELYAMPDEFIDELFDILSDLKTEYYLPPFDIEHGVEKRFEECLQRANRRIFKAINNSASNIDFDSINAFVGLIHRNKIFLSYIGKANAFLFHQKKKHDCAIVDIVNQAEGKKQKNNPEKMFSNIISGEITEKDSLLFGNESILEFFSQTRLSEIVCNNDTASSSRQIQRELEAHRANYNFYSIIIKSSVSAELDEEDGVHEDESQKKKLEASAVVAPEKSLNKLIDTQEDTERYLSPSAMPNWKKALLMIWDNTQKFSLFAFKHGKVAGGHLAKQSKKGAGAIKEKYFDKGKKSNREVNLETIEPENDEVVEHNTPQGAGNHSWHDSQRNDASGIANLTPNDTYSQKISDFINNQIARFVAMGKLQQILLVIALIFVFLFGQNIVWQGQNQTSSEISGSHDLISEISEAINTAEAKNIFNDEKGANASLQKARDLLVQLPDRKKYREDKEKIEIRISDLEKTLQKITYINSPTIVVDLTNKNPNAQIQSITKIENNLFAVDNNNANLYLIDNENKQTLSYELGEDIKNIRKIVTLNDKEIIILLSQNEFYSFNIESKESKKVLSADVEIDDFEIYGNKIYTLQTAENQIFKHTATGGIFNGGSRWVQGGEDLTNASAISIDGGIYVASGNNQILYFMGGNLDKTIELSSISPALGQASQIFSTVESNYIYILDRDNNRLLVFDKNGGLKTQFMSNEFKDMKSIAVDESEKKIYLLSDNKVFGIDITF